MKKKMFLLFLMMGISAAAFGGCGKEDGKDKAYVDEGKDGEDEAVNTIQVGTRYKVVTPMSELKDAVIDILGDNYWPDTLFTAEELAERTGISDNMYHNFLAEYQHSEAGIDMLMMIEAKEEHIGDVEKYLNDYRELLLRIYEKQPLNHSKVFASRIETIQNYVCYVQLGADITGMEGQGEDKMVAFCQHENERALDIIEKTLAEQEE